MEVQCGFNWRVDMNPSIQKQTVNIIKAIDALPEQSLIATIFALNRTAEWLKGRLSKEISAQKRVKLKLIRDRISIQRANRKNPQAQLSCRFKSVFVKDLSGVRQTPIGVSAAGKIYPHAFIATLQKGGKPGVYRRKTTKRIPVKSVTISIFDDAVKSIEYLIGAEAAKVFERRFLHEIRKMERRK